MKKERKKTMGKNFNAQDQNEQSNGEFWQEEIDENELVKAILDDDDSPYSNFENFFARLENSYQNNKSVYHRVFFFIVFILILVAIPAVAQASVQKTRTRKRVVTLDDIKNTVDAIDPETGIKVFDRFGVKTSLRELELKELHKLSLKKMKGLKKKGIPLKDIPKVNLLPKNLLEKSLDSVKKSKDLLGNSIVIPPKKIGLLLLENHLNKAPLEKVKMKIDVINRQPFNLATFLLTSYLLSKPLGFALFHNPLAGLGHFLKTKLNQLVGKKTTQPVSVVSAFTFFQAYIAANPSQLVPLSAVLVFLVNNKIQNESIGIEKKSTLEEKKVDFSQFFYPGLIFIAIGLLIVFRSQIGSFLFKGSEKIHQIVYFFLNYFVTKIDLKTDQNPEGFQEEMKESDDWEIPGDWESSGEKVSPFTDYKGLEQELFEDYIKRKEDYLKRKNAQELRDFKKWAEAWLDANKPYYPLE